jgi:hypothetical protein
MELQRLVELPTEFRNPSDEKKQQPFALDVDRCLGAPTVPGSINVLANCGMTCIPV